MASGLEQPEFKRAFRDAAALLGPHQTVRACMAVLLDRGGDDGYWMRMLPLEKWQFRRVGALAVTARGISYAEVCVTSRKPASPLLSLAKAAAKGAKNFTCFTWKADRDALSDVEVSQLRASPYGPYGQVAFAADGRRMRFGLSQHGQAVLTTIRMLAGSELPRSGSSGELRTDGIYASGIDDLDMGTLFYHFDGSGFALGGRYDGTVRDWVDEATSGAGERIPYRRVGPRYESVEEPRYRKTFEVLPDGRLVLRYHVNEQSSPEFGGFASELWFVPFDRLGQYWGTPPAAVPESPQWWPVLLPNGEMEAPDLGHVRARVKG